MKDWKHSKQITLGTDPVTGKRIRKWIYAKTTTQLAQEEKKAYLKFDRENNPSSLTFEAYAEKWFETYCQPLTFNTSEGYRNAFKKAKDLHRRKLQKITRSDLQSVINDCWEFPYTCKKIKVFFGALFKSAEIDGIIDRNPAATLKIPPTPKEKKIHP